MRKTMLGMLFATVLVFSLILTGCGPKRPPGPDQIISPEPIQGNSGKYMCPYTSDGVLAMWVDKALKAEIGAKLGEMGGAYLGKKLIGQVPIVGGWLGGAFGRKIGRDIAINACGGWDYIRENSDLSFNSIDDMSIFVYVHYSDNEHYKGALGTTMAIYPELNQKRFLKALLKAPKKLIDGGSSQ